MSTRFYHSWSPLAKVGFNLAVAAVAGFLFFFCLKKNYYVFALYEEGVYLLTEFIANSVKNILNLFGYHCYTFGKIITEGNNIVINSLENSLIIQHNEEYIKTLKNWIN